MEDKICPKCGKHLSSFLKDAYLGCSCCYDTFRTEITDSLNNYQGNTIHVGKTPKVKDEDRQIIAYYKELIKQKEVCGLNGEFDKMVEINKTLIELKKIIKGRGLQ